MKFDRLVEGDICQRKNLQIDFSKMMTKANERVVMEKYYQKKNKLNKYEKAFELFFALNNIQRRILW